MESESDQHRVASALKEIGIDVDNIWDLINSRSSYPKAIPVLIRLLSDVSDGKTKEGIVRALSIKDARGVAAPALIDEFKKLDLSNPNWSSLGWAIGNALSLVVVPGEDIFEELVQLTRDGRLGAARQMLPESLVRTKDPRAAGVLLDLLSEEELTGHVIYALGQMKSEKARRHIEGYVNDARPWIRKEAKRALGKIDKAVMKARRSGTR